MAQTKKTKNKSRKQNNNKIGLFISITCIAIVILLISVLINSYALWNETFIQNNPNLVATGCFEISFTDKNENGESTSINLNNTYPISDNNGLNLKPYTFTITNTCSVPAKYKIALSSLNNSTLNEDFISFSFNNTELTQKNAIRLSQGQVTNLDNDTLNVINNNNNPNEVLNTYLLEEDSLDVGQEKTFDLRLWMNNLASNSQMNQNFYAVVSVSSVSAS